LEKLADIVKVMKCKHPAVTNEVASDAVVALVASAVVAVVAKIVVSSSVAMDPVDEATRTVVATAVAIDDTAAAVV
jgi:hypothetical protein